ncbi:hypothetical protein A3A01_00445 [Candidatus Nomurabacteria bacterium RIFCSPLOWO2_01_FULL_39_17]|uniref:MurNAc-LAA domain-containing protein n=1 Tax=Candidatus Nomurabacteria bacterium RIFCSPLOWO2_01_FULL_39_17 TaxID=1801770 RepID=A0A1F6WVB5_9BACT|nr:MAG: hypothetical protein A3A01_00445 [Candidatus Nomurabacteria bacterium RIFCSPLOWO2_01_FULL_39_17]
MRKKLFILSFILFFSAVFVPVFLLYASEPIKILIIPGHDNEVWGAQYGNMKEADMNLRLGTELFNVLQKDKRFEVYITRNLLGYTIEFANYLMNQTDIILFRDSAKKVMQEKIQNGNFVEKTNVPHNVASEDTAIKLYGFNKWANENKIDAIIHIHFNDYPRPYKWTMGQYRGFTIYMPDEQFANFAGSAKLANSIFTQLRKKYATSTYEKENGGLTQDQKLIALGSNNTLIESVNSILIEYGYIYRFGNRTMRHKAYTNMANLTAKGIKNYFLSPP